MKPAKKSRKNLSWQAARSKTIDSLVSNLKPIGSYTSLEFPIATNAYGRAISALDPSDWLSVDAQMECNSSAIRQMVDIMAETDCTDLREFVHRYIREMLF